MGAKRKYQLDETFFDVIDTEEKAYCLGFIFADGYIVKRKKGLGQNVLGIRLSEIEPLEKISKCLQSDKPIALYKSTGGYNNGIERSFYQLTIISNKIVDSLEKLGCIENKSLLLKFPELNNELVPHFIRGYFDGDGSVYYHKQKKWIYLGAQLNGTYEFLTKLRTYLPFLHANEKCIYKENRKRSNTWYLKLLSNKRVRAFESYIYEDATIYLERKRKTFNDYNKLSVAYCGKCGQRIKG